MTTKVILPKERPGTLQDASDAMIWAKFNILLQGVAELTDEYGQAGDATRQLRVVLQEAVRRDLLGISVREREPTEAQLRTWYEVLKQLVEGIAQGRWEAIGDAEEQYREVINAMKDRGLEMPAQKIDMEALDLSGEITSVS